MAINSSAQSNGDFRSITDGDWYNPTTWERYDSAGGGHWYASGAGSNDPGQTPGASNSVWIQIGDGAPYNTTTVTLTQNESCNDLHIATGSGSGASPTYFGVIALQTFTLNVNGKMRCYYATFGSVPGSSSTSGFNQYPFTGTGKVSIVGGSRTIFNSNEWGLGINTPSSGTFPLEINLNSSTTTATMAVSATVTSLNVVAGTLNMASKTIAVNNGTVNAGDVTIASGATVSSNISSGTGNVFQRSPSLLAGTLTVNGTLILTGLAPAFSMNSIVLNGTVQYSRTGDQTFLATVNSSPSTNYLTYSNVTFSGSGTKKTVDSLTTTINGTITIPNAPTFAIGSGGALTYGSSSTLEYAGTAAQSDGVEWPASGGPNSVKINNSAGVTLNNARTINGSLNLTSGIFTANSTLTFGSSASILNNGGSVTGSGYTLPSSMTNFTPASGTTTLSAPLTLTGTLNLSSSDTLNTNGNNLTIGDFSSTGGVIKSSGTGSLTINGTENLASNLLFDQTTPGTTNRIQNLTLNRGTSTGTGSATLGNTLELTGTLTLSNGTFNTGGNLTLVSNVSSTARVGAIPATADISGNVKSQRYVLGNLRQYRMFSPNSSSFTFADLIDNIYVTGTGGASNGFDATPSNSPSAYTYREDTSGIGRGWKAITHINNSLAQGQGALVFVRGDRTQTGWYNSPFPNPNPVTIDFNGGISKGTISPTITYSYTNDIAADGWNLVGNPYPSQIDWTTVSKTNLDGDFWILNPSSGSYVGANTGLIASSQAFFVHALTSSPTITFSETNKSSGSPTNYFKTANPRLHATMIKDSVNSDLLNIEFASGANWNYIATEDIVKMYNSKINFGITTNNGIDVQNSVVPPLTAASDTVKLFAFASSGTYTLNFSGQSSINSNYSIILHDNFTSTNQDLRTNPIYTFSITSNASSSGYNRFQLIFVNPSALPVRMLNLNARKTDDGKNVLINWETISEKNVARFIIERSVQNTNNFFETGTVSANGNSNTLQQYSFKDANSNGIISPIYYRLKIIDRNGEYSYSDVVSIKNDNKLDAMVIFPNPVKEKIMINIPYLIQGSLLVNVYNVVGKEILSKYIFANMNDPISLDVSDLKSGLYFIGITNTNTGEHSTKMLTKE